MFVPVYLAVLAALVFYALLPLIGAFVARSQWRRFRSRVLEAAELPPLSASVAASPEVPAARIGAHGGVDAIGGQHELWVTTEHESFIIDLRGTPVYILTNRAGEDRVEKRLWRELPSLSAGTRVFAAGTVGFSGGRVVMSSAGRDAPLVILHDGNDDDAIRRVIWAGRHENEYWNPLTQVSLALGAATMSVIVPMALPGRMPSLIVALTLTAAFSPVLILLPPGVAGFFVYRRFWRKARYCRARRDMELLGKDSSGRARMWRKRASSTTLASVLAFGGALAVNAWLAIALLRRFL